MSHSICFAGAQGVPKFKIGLGRGRMEGLRILLQSAHTHGCLTLSLVCVQIVGVPPGPQVHLACQRGPVSVCSALLHRPHPRAVRPHPEADEAARRGVHAGRGGGHPLPTHRLPSHRRWVGHLQPVRPRTTPTSCPFACAVFREGSRHIRTQANSTPVHKLCPAGGSWFMPLPHAPLVCQVCLCIPSSHTCVCEPQ
jgi:hypothetical protein